MAQAGVAHAETEVGPIDILVNNSGVSTTQRIQEGESSEADAPYENGPTVSPETLDALKRLLLEETV